MARPRTYGKGKPKTRKSSKGPTAPPGRLRIVAGNWRSRVLEIADVPGLRPTSVRVRETLFNWLAPDVPGCRCLDLFAGTGALGLEALSRGAAEAVFVERSRPAVAALKRNVASLGAGGAKVHEADAIRFLREYSGPPFDIVFLDPPFAGKPVDELCRLLDEAGAVSAGSRIYFEQDRNGPEPQLPDAWRLLRQGTAGNVRYGLAGIATGVSEP